MARFRLRTKFLLSLMVVSVGLTGATLLIVRHSVQLQVRKEISEDLRNSVSTFQHFQGQRELTFSRSAQLLANEPILKALMHAPDAATIQDGSAPLAKTSNSDVFLLADRGGRIVALHTSTPGLKRVRAEELFQQSLGEEGAGHWWLGGGRLYEVFLQPIYSGSPPKDVLLGELAIGYEIDSRVAQEASQIAASQVAFRYGDSVIATTLTPEQEKELGHQIEKLSRGSGQLDEVQLGNELFLATSVGLAPQTMPALRLSVLKSYDQALAFLGKLNHLLLALGLLAVLAGSAFVFLISLTFTRPLENLAAGVRALENGNFAYPLAVRGGDEVAVLTDAFGRMRENLQTAQQKLLDAERLAVIGRMAGPISHDLRHPLTAIVANAEFLSESNLDGRQREELYQEIRFAASQLTDLTESLLEFSSGRESLRPVRGYLKDIVDRAIHSVQANPEFQPITMAVSVDGRAEAYFDPKKLQRAISNLLLNACEAVSKDSGRVEVQLQETDEHVEVLIADNGPGIAPSIREKLFQPFVSHGKEKGIGLGLAIVQKILQDHGGNAILESSSVGRTVFKLMVPITGRNPQAEADLPAASPIPLKTIQ
jgi:signal transduction histidine kinase